MKNLTKLICICLCLLLLCATVCTVNATETTQYNKIRDVYMPETLIVNPPTVVQMVDTQAKLNALQAEVRPQCAWLRISSGTHQPILNDATVTLSQAMDACAGKVIPILQIPDEAAANTIISMTKDKYYDFILASDDTAVLSQLNEAAIPYSRLAYITEDQDSVAVAQKALSCGAMIVVQSQTTRQNAEYLQQRFLTVMINPVVENDELAVRSAVDVGANFVVCDGFEKAYEMYEAVSRIAYIRKAYIVGHRCMVGTAPENTVEGLHEAFKNGADAVEVDIWRTEDDRLVCFHNNYLKGSTTVEAEEPEKRINSYTLAQLEAFTLKPVGEYDNCKIPTLDQMLAALKEYPGKMMVIEIKDYKETGALVRQLVDQYGVADQCVFISFGGNYLRDQRKNNPSLGCSLLTSGQPSDGPGCVDFYYKNTVGLPASFSPSQAIPYNAIRHLHARGVTVNLWTANSLTQMSKMAYNGAQFITTDAVDQGDNVRTYFAPVRMSADSIFGKYVPPAAPSTQPGLLLWIGIPAVLVVSALAVLALVLLKRKRK